MKLDADDGGGSGALEGEAEGVWGRLLSLSFVAFLMLSSARGFLVTVARGRAAALTSRRGSSSSSSSSSGDSSGGGVFADGGGGGGGDLSLSPETLAPLTALLLGMYLLSSLLLLRVNVPCEHRHKSLALVLGGDIEFGFYHQWFDTVFSVSALTAAAARCANIKNARSSMEALLKSTTDTTTTTTCAGRNNTSHQFLPTPGHRRAVPTTKSL
eukprot:CAMPEP_0171935070 /NCGR_PEP_ID=MMETSP0993-20121228/32571_1 /TAXON_ID=483369 /ORGANISM="non described non described, Strain CCMP2098" /LENGTH=212 /DNA_ID=CAMNT_0012575913 /DNA_START=34 /DNA_END=672 /DNA_ORIENTATION=+